jgi:hypothetical protein
MAYVWAALRTLILLATLVVLLFVALVAMGGVLTAFQSSFSGGCIALAAMAAVVSLFGYQLERVAKANKTQRNGTYACLIFGTVAVISLLAPLCRPLFVEWIPVATNVVLRPLLLAAGGVGHIDSAWSANCLFWFFLAPLCSWLLGGAVSCWKKIRRPLRAP